MTTLGGRVVAQLARDAGFSGDEVKRAQAVSFAATRWQDHYTSYVAGVPSLTQAGLFATTPELDGAPSERELLDGAVSAQDAYRLWTAAGGNWDWHPVVRAFDGMFVRSAWLALEAHKLWNSKTGDHQGPVVPFGHPEGTLPPGVYP